MIERILLIISISVSCLYGMKQIRGGLHWKYFNIVFCGIAALLLSRIYYLVLVLSSGNDTVLTVGTLGQASAYLFFLTANTQFLSLDFEEKLRKGLCIPALIGDLLICGIFLLSAVRLHTVSALIGEIIYILCMGSCFYVSAAVLCWRGRIGEGRAAASFNLCVCVLVVGNALGELLNTCALTLPVAVCYYAVVAVAVLMIPAMLPLLRKGMATWKI